MVSEDQRVGRRDILKTTGGVVIGGGLAGCSGNGGNGNGNGGNGNGNGGNGNGGNGGGGGGGSSQPDYVNRPELGSSQQIITVTLDPGFSAPSIDSTGNVYQASYDFLVAESPAPDHELVPRLATEWEVIDNRTFEFTLKEGVMFHSGNELTAEDVIYSFERAYNMEGPAFSTFRGFVTPEGLSAPDDYTVRIELEEPWVHFLGALANFSIVDSQLVQENEQDGDWGHEWMQSNTAGCGPYVMTEWDNSARVRWERFEDYHGGWDHVENPIENIQGQNIEENSTIIQMWDQNEAHYTGHNLAQETYDQLEQRDDTVINDIDTIQVWIMTFNTTKAPYDDVNVRNAISEAVDYEAAQDLIIPGSKPGAGPVPRPMAGHNDDIEPEGAADPEAAQDLLDQADYTLDEVNEAGGMQFAKYRDTGPVDRVPLLWQENLAQIDMESSIRNVTFGEISDSTASPEDAISGYGANWRGGGGAPVTVDPYTYLSHHSSVLGSNFYTVHWWEDEEVDELMEDARASESLEEAREPYNEAQRIINDAKPLMWVSNPRHFVMMREEIDGFNYRATTGQRWYPYEWSWNPE
jgi:peptide/nickel transport system substrate-binding protein